MAIWKTIVQHEATMQRRFRWVIALMVLFITGLSWNGVGAGPSRLDCAPGTTVWMRGQGHQAGTALLARFGDHYVGGGTVKPEGVYAIPLMIDPAMKSGEYPVTVEIRGSREVIDEALCIVPGADGSTPTPVATDDVTPTSSRTGEATTTPTATPTLPPATFEGCDTITSTDASEYPVVIADIDKEEEIVTLENVSAESVDLTGWTMCSVLAGQVHDGISGTLSPGETREFKYPDDNFIWNNEERDDGALYDDQGRLISYWVD